MKKVIISAVAISSLIAGWVGFNETSGIVKACSTHSKIYVTAEYSEYVSKSCTDSEGRIYDCSTWEYYSEPASVVYNVSTFNGVPSFSDKESEEASFLTTYGYYTANYPEHWEYLENDSNFDKFLEHRDTTHTVYLNRISNEGTMTESDHVTKSPSWYNSCMNYKNDGISIKVKTWYGISYSVEGFTE